MLQGGGGGWSNICYVTKQLRSKTLFRRKFKLGMARLVPKNRGKGGGGCLKCYVIFEGGLSEMLNGVTGGGGCQFWSKIALRNFCTAPYFWAGCIVNIIVYDKLLAFSIMDKLLV